MAAKTGDNDIIRTDLRGPMITNAANNPKPPWEKPAWGYSLQMLQKKGR